MLTLRRANAADAEFWQRLGKTLPRSGEAFVIEEAGNGSASCTIPCCGKNSPF